MNDKNITLLIKKLEGLGIDNLYSFKNGTLQLNKLYKVGKVRISSQRYFIDSLFENKSFELLDGFSAQEGDIILAKVLFNPRGKVKVKGLYLLIDSDQSSLVYLKDKRLYNLKSNQEIDGVKHLIKNYKQFDLFLWTNGVLDYLGNINDPKIDDVIVLYKSKQEYRLEPYDFPITDTIDTNAKDRTNLTALDFCTIDPKTAKDHDDAIYYDCNENILYVAIADVSYYVKEGSTLDQEALKRGFSAYFPNKVLPMLPFSLSAGICSLKPNQTRYAYVCKIYFDEDFTVKQSQFIEAIIESKNNFSYEFIDQSIQNNTLPQSLDTLFGITQKLRKRRLVNGFDFRSVGYQLLLDEHETLKGVAIEESSPSHHLVEECMLLANQEAAKKLNNKGIFRVHEEPDIKKIDTLIDQLKDFGLKIKKKGNVHDTILEIQKKAQALSLESEVDKMIIESQQQARYSSIKSSHFGLGFEHYSHFTSPIRRYADLVLHRILKTDHIPSDIDEVCEQISDVEREITKMVWDLEERKYSRWALCNIGKVFVAKITDDQEHPKAQLDEGAIGLRGKISNYRGEKLFSKVRVKIIRSDIISTKIDLEIVG